MSPTLLPVVLVPLEVTVPVIACDGSDADEERP
jgi:hypothetical protein